MFTEEFVSSILPMELEELSNYIMRKKDIKIAESEIYAVSRRVVRFYISMIKRTRGTDYYNRYAHTMVRIVETAFKKQEFERQRDGAARYLAVQRIRDGQQIAGVF